MKKSVYLETSYISYLTCRPSRDLIVAGHQTITREWWEKCRSEFALYISEAVVEECAAGDPIAASDRLSAIEDIELLDMIEEVDKLMEALLQGHGLPVQAAQDAAHVAIASVHNIDYLLTWNCKHIANAHRRHTIETICLEHGYNKPNICTPEGLLGAHAYDVARPDS